MVVILFCTLSTSYTLFSFLGKRLPSPILSSAGHLPRGIPPRRSS
nr:MAG TPA: hypothetical protein [Caudoviricetes sp.]